MMISLVYPAGLESDFYVRPDTPFRMVRANYVLEG